MNTRAVDNAAEVVQALTHDNQFGFTKLGNYLQKGTCPGCKKKEAYVAVAKPWRVVCNRHNNCGYSQSTRSLYPELWDNYSERHPSSEDDPHATARAYLEENRGFNSALIAGLYEQGVCKIKNSRETADTVRFYLDDNKDRYWERIMDTANVKAAGKKANFGGARKSDGSVYRNGGWQPKGQTIEQGDYVWFCEGIFKSMALMHIDYEGAKVKSTSPLSSNNLQRDLIKANLKKDVTWVIALDNDKAGIEFAAKYREEIRSMGEKVLCAFPRGTDDWDDELRNGKLNQDYLKESIWRGYVLLSETAKERAFWTWVKSPRTNMRFAHEASLWRFFVDEKQAVELRECLQYGPTWLASSVDIAHQQNLFYSAVTGERISNCHPQFLYIEQDVLTEEQLYFFKFDFISGNPTSLVSLDGSSLESPGAFNKALLTRTSGGTFDGSSKDLKQLRDKWFNRHISYVRTIPFVGYYKEAGAYVFPSYGYQNGRVLELNAQGFMQAGKERMKSGLKSINLVRSTHFDQKVIAPYTRAFGQNGLMLMAWWLGTLFAEQIRTAQKSWCFLEYTGDQGSGKSTQIEFLWNCCGRQGYEGFDPAKATSAGRMRNFMQVSNLPVVLIEGDRNSDDRGARRGGFDLDELKTAYNGRGIRTMGVKKRGSDTEEPPFRGAVLISQNATVDGSEALLSRIVHGHVTRANFTRQTETDARALAAMEPSDLSGWMDSALSQESALMEMYLERYEQIEEIYQQQGQGKVQNRLVHTHAQVAAWGWCLAMIFGDQWPKDASQNLQDHIWQRCLNRQQRLMSDHPLVEQFWEIYELLNIKVRDNNIRYNDLDSSIVLNHSKDPTVIAIHLQHFATVCSANRAESITTIELKRLLPHSQKHKFMKQGKVRSQITNGLVHCWIFDAS